MFIKIGEGRIKRSNIKNYGVGKEERTRENSLMDRIDNMEYEDGVLNKVSAFLKTKNDILLNIFISPPIRMITLNFTSLKWT